MSESNITLEYFKEKWERIISKIENEAIDGQGVELIRLHFHLSKHLFEMSLKESEITPRLVNELEILEAELETALQIAYSRFKLKNRGILARIFGGIIERRPLLHEVPTGQVV